MKKTKVTKRAVSKRQMSREEVVSTIHGFVRDLTLSRGKVTHASVGLTNHYFCVFRGENVRIVDSKNFGTVYIGKVKVSCLTWRLSRAVVRWAEGQYRDQQRVRDDKQRVAAQRRGENLQRQPTRESLRLAKRIKNRKR